MQFQERLASAPTPMILIIIDCSTVPSRPWGRCSVGPPFGMRPWTPPWGRECTCAPRPATQHEWPRMSEDCKHSWKIYWTNIFEKNTPCKIDATSEKQICYVLHWQAFSTLTCDQFTPSVLTLLLCVWYLWNALEEDKSRNTDSHYQIQAHHLAHPFLSAPSSPTSPSLLAYSSSFSVNARENVRSR